MPIELDELEGKQFSGGEYICFSSSTANKVGIGYFPFFARFKFLILTNVYITV
jgi:hypothetical protein